MYKVTITNNETETIIHSPNVNGLKLPEAKVDKSINAIDAFKLSMYLNNPGYGKMKPFKTLITIFNTKTNEFEFEGRVLTPNESMDSGGLISASYTCEGELGYLHDSQQRHLEFRGTPFELLTTLLDYHNVQVEEEDYKKFYVGNVTVTDPNDFMYVYLSAEQTTFNTIKDKLTDRLGGELQIRKVDGVRYLDYLVRIGEDKASPKIKLAKNLISVSRDIDPTEIVTRLTPLGSRIESEDETATDASQERLTIKSVNNGFPYIDRPDLINLFGIQGGSITWDDVTTAARLKTNGQNWLDTQKVVLNQYQIKAVDLSLIGLDIGGFTKGNSYKVINPIMAIDEYLKVIGTSTNLNAPEDSSLTIGDKFLSRSEYQVQSIQSAKRVTELQGQLDRQTTQVIQLRHAYQGIADSIQSVQQDLINIDSENLPVELQGIHDQLDNIADAIAKLPVYGPVNYVNDGLMIAGDKAKLDRIGVNSQVDLDTIVSELSNLIARVEALEVPEEDI